MTVPASSLKDAYHILRRRFRNEAVVRERLDGFRQIVTVVDLTGAVLDAVFSSNEPDLEDGIVHVTAELLGATAIIARDAAVYGGSPAPAWMPARFSHGCAKASPVRTCHNLVAAPFFERPRLLSSRKRLQTAGSVQRTEPRRDMNLSEGMTLPGGARSLASASMNLHYNRSF